MNKKLSEIKIINPREIWKREPDFTDWLAQRSNLDILAKEIGIEMNLVRTEAPAGRFNLDILAEDIGDKNRLIAIENMLNMSNHTHVGQLLTYGSTLDTKVLVLVVTDICDEHEQVFKWLNEITRPEYSFFIVKFELIQIDNSNPAPNFEILVQPNEWARTLKNYNDNKEPTEHKLLQLEFWEAFKKYLNENNLYLRIQHPRPVPYRDIRIGCSDAHILLRINIPDNQLSCSLYIKNNKDLVEYLKQQQVSITKELGQSFIWVDCNVHSRAEISKQNIGDFNPFDVANFQWLFDKSTLFEKVFIKYIDAFNAE